MTETGTHRAHLDGIRTFAVYAVVLFHAGVAQFSGGFIGVDVFFVLSGYLVTQVLLKDIDGLGHIRFGRFYSRRIRRLLPASAMALLITAFFYRAVAAPGNPADSMRSFQAAFSYAANWHFISESAGYFGSKVTENPLKHFWSLAVEVQFYVVWPLLLAGLFAVSRRIGRTPPTSRVGETARVEAGRSVASSVRVAVAVSAVASLAWALSLQGQHLDRAYYGTDTRAYQLLAGALLAFTPGVVDRLRQIGPRVRWIGVAAFEGLLVLSTSFVSPQALPPVSRGAAATVLALALIASLDAVPSGPMHRMLASPPSVYLGKISYGTYLWHWPVIVVLVIVAEPRPVPLALTTILLASGLASLSSALVEQPILLSKRLDGRRSAVIALGLSISLVCGLVVIPSLLHRTTSTDIDVDVVATSRRSLTSVPEDLPLEAVAAQRFGKTVSCVHREPEACTIVKGRGNHIVLMGDSNAEMLIPAFQALAEREDLTLSLAVIKGCSWQRGVYAASSRAVNERCRRHKEDAYDRVIPALEPDIVVAVNVIRVTPSESAAVMEQATERSVEDLRAPGRTIVLVEPVVNSPADEPPLACLQHAEHLEDCRFEADTEPSWTDQMYARVAKGDDDVQVMDLDPLVCPGLPICEPVAERRIVRWDYQHISAGYSASLGDDLARLFRAKALIP